VFASAAVYNFAEMLTPTVLVFERRPRWVPELQRQFLGQDVRVRGCSSLKDVEQLLAQSPGSLAILELDAEPAPCLMALARLMARSPSPTILVVASPAYRELEWRVRELGAAAFLVEPVPGDEMAESCRRQFRSAFTQTPQPEMKIS
jgi:DNA-binding response OmpR family regulator